MSNHSSNVVHFDSTYVVELKNDWVRLSAIDTWVIRQP